MILPTLSLSLVLSLIPPIRDTELLSDSNAFILVRVTAFKKRHEDEPDLVSVDDGDDRFGADDNAESDGLTRAGFLWYLSLLAHVGGCAV